MLFSLYSKIFANVHICSINYFNVRKSKFELSRLESLFINEIETNLLLILTFNKTTMNEMNIKCMNSSLKIYIIINYFNTIFQ